MSELPFQGLGLHADATRHRRRPRPGLDPGVVHAAIDAGVTMVDTADMYGNEALVGRTLRGRRDEVLLCSKFGVVWGEDGDWSVRADATYVREACEASLRRLDVETIDLVLPAPPQRRGADRGDGRGDGRTRRRRQDPRGRPVQRHRGGRAPRARRPPGRRRAGDVGAQPPGGRSSWSRPWWSSASQSSHTRRPATARCAFPSCPGHCARWRARTGSLRAKVALAWVHHRAAEWNLRVAPLPGTTSVAHLKDNVAAAALALTAGELAHLEQVRQPPAPPRASAG